MMAAELPPEAVAELVNMIDRQTEMPEDTQEAVLSELDYQPDEPAPEGEACPRCGGTMQAQADPDSLLSYPMKYVFKCGCGHTETREDDFEFNEEDVPAKA